MSSHDGVVVVGRRSMLCLWVRLSIREKRRKVIKTASSGPCFPLEPDEFVDLTRTRRRNMFICFPDRVTVTSQRSS